MTLFEEKLRPPFSLFFALVLVIPATILVFLPVDVTAGVVVAIVLYLGLTVFVLAIAPTITVSEEGLRVGSARLPASAIGDATAFVGREATAARGVDLDARAHHAFRGGIDAVVRVEVTDDDPTPYWLVSTRRPEQLVEALAKVSQRTPGR